MSFAAPPPVPAPVQTVLGGADDTLGAEVLAHLQAQLVSARRLLSLVIEQGAAIRDRNVQQVVNFTGLLQAELQRRSAIEVERIRLLQHAGVLLGVDPGEVTLSLLGRLLPADAAEVAHAMSGELRGMLAVIQREHHVNRVLMNQELAFLDQLLRLADADGHLGYDSAGDSRTAPPRLAGRHRVLDMEV
jgi:hypothetical protein